MTITLRGGVSHSIEVDRTANPRYLNPSDADIEGKFCMIATPVLGQAQADAVVRLVSRLETLSDIGELMQALRPSK